MEEMNTYTTAEAVINEYADMVYRLALAQVKNKTDADDIFQEVFVRLVKNLHKLSGQEHIKAWLLRVTINCAKKHFSSSWNKKIEFFTDENSIYGDGQEAGVESDGIKAVLNGESPVTTAISLLPEKYRIVVHLFYYEELSVLQIAKTLNQKETTIKSWLFRARGLLKETLKGDVDL